MSVLRKSYFVNDSWNYEVCSGLDRTSIEFNGWPSLYLPWEIIPSILVSYHQQAGNEVRV